MTRQQRDSAGTDPENVRAAIYARMSTEHQQYSPENQCDVIREYAKQHGMIIVKTYMDKGKSGLSLSGRDGLKRLIEDVEKGRPEFEAVLVYDVSRWGRFQDADESAYYEYVCRKAGVRVMYCAEQFENDGSMASVIVKSVKRTMAGEYSRELSSKVFQGQCRLIQLGYRQGGGAGYGLRRMLIDQHGRAKGELAVREHKSIQTDRVVLIPGPKQEVRTIRWIYRQFIEKLRSEAEIAELLNARGLRTDLGRPWTRGTVRQVLTNEKYIGNNVYNRTSYKLKKKRVKNPPDMWIRADGVFEAIVDRSMFAAAQALITERTRVFTDQELLDRLKALHTENGRLSAIIIDEDPECPGSQAYRNRFGSLVRAYKMVGYTPEKDYAYIGINRRLREIHPSAIETILTGIRSAGGTVAYDESAGLVTVNSEFTASLVIARCRQTNAGSLRWVIRLEWGAQPDITIAARMDAANQHICDYYLLPAIVVNGERVRLSEDNGLWLDAFRFDSLDFLFAMALRTTLSVAA